jgi:hypothetical protein
MQGRPPHWFGLKVIRSAYFIGILYSLGAAASSGFRYPPKLLSHTLQESDLDLATQGRVITFPAKHCQAYQWDRLRRLIVQATNEEQPPSLASVCKNEGVDLGRVFHEPREEAKALIDRRRTLLAASTERRTREAKPQKQWSGRAQKQQDREQEQECSRFWFS